MAGRKSGSNTESRAPNGTFRHGNPGKPRGTRHKITRAVEALLDGEAEAITRKAIEMAKAGDLMAIRVCLDRISPPRKDRSVDVALPPVTGAEDIPRVLAAILAAVSAGDLTPGEAQQLGAVLEMHRKAEETAQLAARVAALEEARDGR